MQDHLKAFNGNAIVNLHGATYGSLLFPLENMAQFALHKGSAMVGSHVHFHLAVYVANLSL